MDVGLDGVCCYLYVYTSPPASREQPDAHDGHGTRSPAHPECPEVPQGLVNHMPDQSCRNPLMGIVMGIVMGGSGRRTGKWHLQMP